MKIFSVMNKLMRNHIGFVLLSLLMGLLTILSNIGMLSTSSVLISRAALHPDVLDLMVLIVAVRFFGISRGVFRYLERLISHDATFKILSSLRRWFYKSFNENYSENNKQFKTGEIYTKLVNDVDSLKEFYLRGVYPLLIAVLTGICTAAFIFYFRTLISIVYLLIYIFTGFVLPFILYSFNSRIIKREAELKKEINLLLLDSFNGCLEAEVYSLREEMTSSFKKLSKELTTLQKKRSFINIIGESAHSLLASFMIALALMVSMPLVQRGELQGIYYAMLPLALMASFEALIPMPNILYKFSEAYESGKNIFSIIENTEVQGQTEKKVPDSYDLSIKGLGVKKSNTEDYIIKDISFELPYRKKLALVGASGSGKSTILKALMGFIKFQEGDIKIGEASYSYFGMEDIRRLYSYTNQNPYVFNTSIKENLLIANTEAEEKELFKALEKTKAIDLIKTLPEELDSSIGQYGFSISGGEKQRVAIARSLLKDSRILLLDEPTAGLDVNTEKLVIASIHEELKDKSCIWVTHRLVAMDKMDEILVLHRGRIVERGTHKELLDKRGRYFKLWNIQQNSLN